MTVDLNDLDRIEVHDLWSDIVERSRQLPTLPLASGQDADRTTTRSVRVIGGLAAAACLAGGLLIARHDSGERQDRSPSSSADEATALAAVPSLAGLVLPSTVPDGWHLVELSTASMMPNRNITQPAGQLYRRTRDGAAIRLIITPSDDSVAAPVTTVTAVEGQRGTVGFEAGVQTFREAGADVTVQIAGVDDDEAAGFLRLLSASGTGAELRYTSNAPGWELESTLDFKPAAPDLSPYGQVTYRSDDGRIASFSVTNDDPTNGMWRLGVPTDLDGVTIYRLDGGAVRQVGPLLVAGSFAADGSTADQLALLAAFDIVDADGWRVAADQLAATYRQLPVIGRLGLGEVTVTLHSDGVDVALCANRRDVSRCVPDRTRWFGTAGLPRFDGDVNLDGTWVHVGASDASTLQGITARTNAGPADADWATTDTNGVIIAAVAPDAATTMTVNAQEDVTTFWGADTARPLD